VLPTPLVGLLLGLLQRPQETLFFIKAPLDLAEAIRLAFLQRLELLTNFG
jgi:hypothetical protein